MRAAAFVRALAAEQGLTEGRYLALLEQFSSLIEAAGVRIGGIVQGDESAVAGVVPAASDAKLMRSLSVALLGKPWDGAGADAGTAVAVLSKLPALRPLKQKLLQAFFAYAGRSIGGNGVLAASFRERFPDFPRTQCQAASTESWDVFVSDDLEELKKWSNAADLGQLAAKLAAFLPGAALAERTTGERCRQATLQQARSSIERTAAGGEKALKTRLAALLKLGANTDLLEALINWWTDSHEANSLLLRVHERAGADDFWGDYYVRAALGAILELKDTFTGRSAGTRQRLCLLKQCYHDMALGGFDAACLDVEHSISRFPELWVGGKPVDYDVFYEILRLGYEVGSFQAERAESAAQTEWAWAGVEVALGSEDSSVRDEELSGAAGGVAAGGAANAISTISAGSATQKSSPPDSWDDALQPGAAQPLESSARAADSDVFDDWE